MIELGGNIKLDGFSSIDPSTLIVVKKIVGNYAKRMQREAFPFQELSLHLNNAQEPLTLHAKLKGKKEWSAHASDRNLFFAIDKALSSLIGEAKKDRQQEGL